MITINGNKVTRSIFPGGEVHVELPPGDNSKPQIIARIQSSDDLMELLLVLNALKQEQILVNEVYIPYLPYARQDRRCNPREAFSLEVLAGLLKDIPVVTTLDVHSDVALKIMPNLKSIPFEYYSKEITYGKTLVYPDEGAYKRLGQLGIRPSIVLNKTRDPLTGDITGMGFDVSARVSESDYMFAGEDVLIVDDICDGGRTFIKAANFLRKELKVGSIDLFVTHGIFSNTLSVFEDIIDTIYCTNSLEDELTWYDDIRIIKRVII